MVVDLVENHFDFQKYLLGCHKRRKRIRYRSKHSASFGKDLRVWQ